MSDEDSSDNESDEPAAKKSRIEKRKYNILLANQLFIDKKLKPKDSIMKSGLSNCLMTLNLNEKDDALKVKDPIFFIHIGY